MYSTVKITYEIVYEEKKSKFITQLIPVEDRKMAENRLHEIKKEHPHANHHVFAYVIQEADGVYQKAWDDHEPKNTAGKPILDIILRHHLMNVMIVVIRYFGGIKLGAGGLIRAYAAAAKGVVEISDTVTYERETTILFLVAYSEAAMIDALLTRLGVEQVERGYQEQVFYKVTAPQRVLETLKNIKKIEFI